MFFEHHCGSWFLVSLSVLQSGFAVYSVSLYRGTGTGAGTGPVGPVGRTGTGAGTGRYDRVGMPTV